MYTPALMTEGVTAALIAWATWMASRRSRLGLALVGVVTGVATLVRPQSLLMAPCLGLLCAAHDASLWVRVRRGALATALAIAVCGPWTIRNCVRMHRCALVSFNGGWNLLIGAAENATGAWAPVEVPEACRTVWDEAEKDACFEHEARHIVARDPARWVGLAPRRLAATFDYAGAPGFYLHASNPDAFGTNAKFWLGVVETGYERMAYLGALIAAAFARGPRRKARIWVCALSGIFLIGVHAYLAVLGLVVALGLRGMRLLEGPTLVAAAFFSMATTAAVHAVFFGSGRYSMVVFPLVTGLALVGIGDHDHDHDHDRDRA
jgi:hypothetical protein